MNTSYTVEHLYSNGWFPIPGNTHGQLHDAREAARKLIDGGTPPQRLRIRRQQGHSDTYEYPPKA